MDKKGGIDILLPYHGQYNMVRDLVGNIMMFTRNIPYRITLIDDASENSNFFRSLSTMTEFVDGIRQEKQKGFGAALNLGIKMTKLPWIAILNSDIKIDEMGWLNDLHESLIKLNKSDKVGLVSARSDNPPKNCTLLKVSKKRTKIDDQVVKESLPLFCCLTARSVIEKVGEFKEYPYGGYEDEEYFWRMKKNGYNQGISGKTWVKHYGEATIKEVLKKDPSIKQIMEGNRQRCIEDIKLLVS